MALSVLPFVISRDGGEYKANGEIFLAAFIVKRSTTCIRVCVWLTSIYVRQNETSAAQRLGMLRTGSHAAIRVFCAWRSSLTELPLVCAVHCDIICDIVYLERGDVTENRAGGCTCAARIESPGQHFFALAPARAHPSCHDRA